MNPPAEGETSKAKPEPASKRNDESSAVVPEQAENVSYEEPKEEDPSTDIINTEKQVNKDDDSADEKNIEKDVVQEKELELQPKLSFPAPDMLDFVPPEPVNSRQQFTPPRGNQPVVVQQMNSFNPKSHYQITWNPASHQAHPSHGYSPPPRHNNFSVPFPGSPHPPPSQERFFNPTSPCGAYYAQHHHYHNQQQPWYPPPPPPSHEQFAHYNPYFPPPGGPYYPYPPSGVSPYPPPPRSKQRGTLDSPTKLPSKSTTAAKSQPKQSDIISQSASDGSSGDSRGEKGDSDPPHEENPSAMTNVELSGFNQGAINPNQTKIFVRSATNTNPQVAQRKQRKNQMSRSRAHKRKHKIEEIQAKSLEQRTMDEQETLEHYLKTRARKNNRSRERAMEQKEEVERIQRKPASERTNIEISFLQQYTEKRQRKNEGDRLRRAKLKELGISKGSVSRPGVSARGPLVPRTTWSIEGGPYTQSPTHPPSGPRYFPTPAFSPYGTTGYSPYGPYGSWEHGESPLSPASNVPLPPPSPISPAGGESSVKINDPTEKDNQDVEI